MTWTGSDSLKGIKTPSLLVLLGWSTRTKLYPSILSRLQGIVESIYVSERNIKSYLYIEICDFDYVSFEKLWADKLLRFRWQTKRDLGFNFCGTGSIFPLGCRRGNMYVNVNKKMKELSK